jgi:hypothetical protein
VPAGFIDAIALECEARKRDSLARSARSCQPHASMSTRPNRLLAAAAAAAAVSAGLLAQPELASIDSEQQLRRQIAELQTETGLARPAGLIDPLRALAVLHEEAGDHALAVAALEEARFVTRVHQGLASADEALLLRQQIRSEKALGNHERVWELEQDMVTMARQHHDDVRMFPIFRELADDRLSVIEKVSAGERPPLIYVGCYNDAPPPPYDYTRRTSGPMDPGCIGGINQRLVGRLRAEILMYYADAIEIILRIGDYASPDLRQLEKAALRFTSGRARVLLTSKSEEPLAVCPTGTLDDYLAMEILDSCLAPVARGPGFVFANVGNLGGLIRLLSYEVRNGAPAAVRANALAELADWRIVTVPADRRRFDVPAGTFALYERAYREIREGGDLRAATQLFTPELPVTLPAYEPNPFASAATESSRYIDVAFAVTKHGLAERIKVLGTSKDATRAEEKDLIFLIESTSFRPRFVDGALADSAPVIVRYHLP